MKKLRKYIYLPIARLKKNIKIVIVPTHVFFDLKYNKIYF